MGNSRPVTAYPTRISKASTAVSADHAYTVLPIPLEVPNVSGPTCKHCSDMRWPCRQQLFARGHRWLLNTRSDAASVSTSNMPATAHQSIPQRRSAARSSLASNPSHHHRFDQGKRSRVMYLFFCGVASCDTAPWSASWPHTSRMTPSCQRRRTGGPHREPGT